MSTLTRRAFVRAGGVSLTAALARAAAPASFAAPANVPSVALTGRIIRPGDSTYDQARLDFNARFSRFPKAIVVCNDASDVRHAVRWARKHGVPPRARSGGHSYEAFSVVDGGLVIDVRELNGVAVDLARGEATVGAGIRLGELYTELGASGVTIPAGSCPGVGIAGLALGGGIGVLSRQHGLTCDQLRAVELVNANGDVLHVSEFDHPDLVWALRGGGGGNFGIATSFTFEVTPIPDMATCSATWPWADAAAAIDAWQHWAPAVDERLVAELIVSAGTPGSVALAGWFTGATTELPALLSPLFDAVPPLTADVGTTSYLDVVAPSGSPPTHALFKNTSTLAYDPLSAAGMATLVDHLSMPLPPGVNLVQLFPFGGAIAAIDQASTAFVHRRALFDLQYQAYWSDPADEAAQVDWVRSVRLAMLPYTNGAYVNYIDADDVDWAVAYYGANLARLEAVKAAYDSDNLFNGPQSIPL